MVDLRLLALDGHGICISLKRYEIARKALAFLQLVDHEELLTRCGAILLSSEDSVRLLPTAALTVLARAKPVPAFMFAGPAGVACVSAAASLFQAADWQNEASIPVRWCRLEAV